MPDEAPKENGGVVHSLGSLLLILSLVWFFGSILYVAVRFPEIRLWPLFLSFLSLTWWFWLFVILVPLTESAWLFWKNETFRHSKEFDPITLELRIPREIRKSPRAMEQLLMQIHALRNAPGDFRETWIDGEITRWYALEMVSFGGETHFYVRTHSKQKSLVEAAFFSYYPDVELMEVDDYTERFPDNIQTMYRQGYDLWGAEMKLGRPEAFPIRTYKDFEAVAEEKEYDPVAVFLEVMSRLKKEEMVGIQLLLAPIAPTWKDKWESLIEELRSKAQLKQKDKKEKLKTLTSFPGKGVLPAFEIESKKSEKDPFASFMRTPGEADVLKAVEANLSQQAFHTLIRFIYFSPKNLFYDSFPRRGIAGAFNQYAALDLNFFGVNYKKGTRTKVWNWPYIFPEKRNEYKKERLLFEYKHREMPHKTFIGTFITSYFWDWNNKSVTFAMTTQCLATLFHPPTYLVLTAPHLKRLESRKAGPPAGLAIFGGEKEIEKYM